MDKHLSLQSLKDEDTSIYEAIFNSTAEGVVVIDQKGVIQKFNSSAEEIFGYPASEVIGQNVSILMPSDTAQEHDSYLEKSNLYESKIIDKERELLGRKKDGVLIPISLKVTPIELKGEKAFVGAVSDISDQKKHLTEILQAQKMIAVGELAGGLAHDFKNMLSVIIGNIQLARIFPGDPKNEERFNNAEEASIKGSELANRLLTFSREQHAEVIEFDASECIRDLRPMLIPLIGEQIELTTKGMNVPVLIRADKHQFENAILNLVINAKDAIDSNGEIEILVYKQGRDADRQHSANSEFVAVSVRDSGSGIPQDIIEKIFDPFFTTKIEGAGTGLGLAMVKNSVEKLGGFIDIESEINKGTTIILNYPTGERNSRIIQREEVPANDIRLGNNENVMIVEDDPDVREIAIEILKGLNYQVIDAGDGRNLPDILAKNDSEIDLLLSDIVLPEGQFGPQLAELVTHFYPAAKVLFMTGYAEKDLIEATTNNQSYKIIKKPFSTVDLSKVIEELIMK